MVFVVYRDWPARSLAPGTNPGSDDHSCQPRILTVSGSFAGELPTFASAPRDHSVPAPVDWAHVAQRLGEYPTVAGWVNKTGLAFAVLSVA